MGKIVKVSVVSLSKELERDFKRKLKTYKGVALVKRNPNFVFTYGGDGSILYAERKYPEVPKVVIKKSHFCHKCDYPIEELDRIIELLRKGKYSVIERTKLYFIFKKKKFVALNEVQVRNKYPTQSIRFDVKVKEGKEFKPLLVGSIGDGIIFSTPFGSSSYYRSVGGHPFEKGIGVALNNAQTEKKRYPEVFQENAVFEFVLKRGTGLLAYDNDNDNIFVLKKGDKVVITSYPEKAKFVIFEDIKVLTNYLS